MCNEIDFNVIRDKITDGLSRLGSSRELKKIT
jgi:hypothetical protein